MKDYDERIKELLGKMTLEEKVGQLQQCGPSLVGAFDVSFEELLNMMFDGRISQEEFGRLMGTAEQDFHEEDLRAGRIGSYNGVGDAETVNRLQKIAVEETRLGIPLLFGYDVIHGFKTVTPIPLAESCAWEPDLWERTGRMAADEATAAGVHMTFAPMVDAAKDARWGRVSEGAGEDALLNGLYGAAKVKGFQGEDLSRKDSMAACVKHFAAYGAGEAGRDYNRVDMSEQRLYEEYLPAYKACIDAGARAVMPAFNDINGVPCSVSRKLLRDILREDWGFDGMTVSDSNAIAECVDHGIAEDKRDAAKQAILAGMDMDMSSNSYIENMKELVESGEVPMDVLDEAVANILRGDRHPAVIGSREKDNVPRLCLGGRNDGALVVNALRRGTGQVVDAACGIDPADEAGAVKGSGRAGASPHIGITDILRGLGHQRRKRRVGQGLAGYLVSGARAAAFRVNPFPQVGLVAFELLHDGVNLFLLFVHPRENNCRKGTVFERHVQDVILVGDFLAGGFPGLRVGAGLGAVADLHFLGQGQLVLGLKNLPQLRLHLFPGVNVVLCRQVGGQLIGIVADLVHRVAVLVIARVVPFNIRHGLGKLPFHSGIVLVRP